MPSLVRPGGEHRALLFDLDDFAPRERGCGPYYAHAGEVACTRFHQIVMHDSGSVSSPGPLLHC